MSQKQVTYYKWSDVPRETVMPTLDRQLITGEGIMLAHVHLKKGCIVPMHNHLNEQVTWVVSGGLRFWIGQDEARVIDVLAGDVLTIPPYVWHKAEALEDTLDVDIFSPPREDWLNKTDAYLRDAQK